MRYITVLSISLIPDGFFPAFVPEKITWYGTTDCFQSPKGNMALSTRVARASPGLSIYLCFQLTTVYGWIPHPAVPLGLFTYLAGVFFWVSHKVLSIHSLVLASLVSIQHPMGPGFIHSLQGNGDGTVTPKWSGERGATSVSETEICMSGSPASALLWTEYFAAYELSPWSLYYAQRCIK